MVNKKTSEDTISEVKEEVLEEKKEQETDKYYNIFSIDEDELRKALSAKGFKSWEDLLRSSDDKIVNVLQSVWSSKLAAFVRRLAEARR